MLCKESNGGHLLRRTEFASCTHGTGFRERCNAHMQPSVRSSGDQTESELRQSNRNSDNHGMRELSVEELFVSTEVPPWRAQITFRGVLLSFLLGILFSVLTLKFSLTTGIVPDLNISVGFLGFLFMKSFTTLLSQLGIPHKPFTRQENTVIQSCVVACYSLAFSGGYGSYLTAMDQKSYVDSLGSDGSANDSAAYVKNPHLTWIIPYMFAVGFLGLFAIVPFRKIMIIDYKLTFPGGTATSVLINSFHTPNGSGQAMEQVTYFWKYFSFSSLFSFFKWYFSGNQNSCGFDFFPSLGLKAYANKFYFDFNMAFVGSGMICPHLINVSLLLGSILSWGIMWPLISNKAGDWYPKDATSHSIQGLNAYKVFVGISLILGDGLYNFLKITSLIVWSLYHNWNSRLVVHRQDVVNMEDLSSDEQRRNDLFMKDEIPFKAAALCYVALAVVSALVIPQIFHQMKWHYVALSYCAAPILGFCNAYCFGLTDWTLPTLYGKLGLFVFAAWAGKHVGVIVGLVSCGVMMIAVDCSAGLMQELKTGYLTLSSPRSIFASRILGTAMGCIIAPSTFWLFWEAFPIGDQNTEYPAPSALIFRQMATVSVQGFGALPKHCLGICYGFFCMAIVINFLRDKPLAKWAKYIPIPMAMAIPFYYGPYFSIDMFVGTVIVFMWQRLNRNKADMLVLLVGSGLICGDGIWTLVSAVLTLAQKQAPICMYFFPTKVATRLNLTSMNY